MANYILLTQVNGQSIAINLNLIVHIEPGSNYTEIQMNRRTITVREPFETVIKRIQNAGINVQAD